MFACYVLDILSKFDHEEFWELISHVYHVQSSDNSADNKFNIIWKYIVLKKKKKKSILNNWLVSIH